MNLDQIMQALKAAGTEQTRKTYARHGYPADTYGVSFADLKKLAKNLDGDQGLARQLWATGNGDACTLATMIADPEQTTAKELDAWVKTVRFAALAQMLARYVADTKFARAKADEWIQSPNEFIAETGYHVLSLLAVRDEDLPDKYFEGHLKTIESSIQTAPNRTRYGMNQAVISIGVRNPKLTKLALAAAKRIGKVEVDHGDTACKTPDAAAYIQKTLAASK
jgi:3-methyladenine DNA glycosylase AlkD